MSPDTAIVFAGGDPLPPAVAERLPADAFVIAADSGLHHAAAIGRRVDLVVGDLDSVTVEQLAAARADGAAVETHPAEKDASDLELALDAACARGARSVTVAGGHGGRLDHLLVNLSVLAGPRFAPLAVDAWLGATHAVVVRDETELRGRPGALLTLVAMGGTAHGVTTDGLRYRLDDDDLEAGTSLGLSNVFVDERATVRVRSGTVLAVRPDALSHPAP